MDAAEHIYELKFECLRGFLWDNADLSLFQGLSKKEWALFLKDIVYRGLAPALWKYLSHYKDEIGIPREISHRLQKIHYQSAASATIVFNQLHNLLHALKCAGSDFILLKGAYFCEHIYEDISLRPMSDIDLLAPKETLDFWGDILNSCGYNASHLNPEMRRTGKHLMFEVEGRDLTIELHYIPGDNFIPAVDDFSALDERGLYKSVAGELVTTLSPEDSILYAAYHAAKHSYGRYAIRDLLDITLLIDKYQNTLDWDYILDKTISWRIDNQIYTTLTLANEILNAPLNLRILEKLKPAKYDKAILSWLKEYLTRNVAQSPIRSTYISDFFEARGIIQKLKIIYNRCFSRKTLTDTFGAEIKPLKYWYYIFLRLKNLSIHHSHSFFKLILSSKHRNKAVKEENENQRFLSLLNNWQK